MECRILTVYLEKTLVENGFPVIQTVLGKAHVTVRKEENYDKHRVLVVHR